jgi:hypothetical protein
VSTIEELVGRNSSDTCLEIREYGHRDLLHCPRDTLCPQKLALTSPTSGGRSVGIVRPRNKATEFVLFVLPIHNRWCSLLACICDVLSLATTLTVVVEGRYGFLQMVEASACVVS